MFNVLSSRWAAFGTGNSMIGSDIYVFWKNSTGGCVVSRRKSTGYSLPILSDYQNLTVLPTPTQSMNKLSCAISRPNSDIPVISNATGFIWAIGGGVQSPDVIDSRFSRHFTRGKIGTSSIIIRETSESNDMILYESNGWSYFQGNKFGNHFEMEKIILMIAFLFLLV